MKKSLLVISVILLIAGLFISCNSEAAETSNGLAEVKFAEAESKSLDTTTSVNPGELPDVNALYWWYKASKTTPGGNTGAQSSWTRVSNEPGLAGHKIGAFSLGGWHFDLLAVAGSSDQPSDDTKVLWGSKDATLVRNQTNEITVNLESHAPSQTITLVFDEDLVLLNNTVSCNVEWSWKAFIDDSTTSPAASGTIDMNNSGNLVIGYKTGTTPFTITTGISEGVRTIIIKVYDNNNVEMYSAEKAFLAFPGATITVSGSLDELKTDENTSFDPGTITPGATSYEAYLVSGTSATAKETLSAAAEVASDNDTIYLAKNVTYGEDHSVEVWNTIFNIDFCGNKLKTESGVDVDLNNMGYKASGICFEGAANGDRKALVVENGSIETKYGACIYADGMVDMTINDMDVKQNYPTNFQITTEYSGAVRLTSKAKVTINSGVFQGMYSVVISNSGGFATINGGTFNSPLYFANYCSSGLTKEDKTITITGGTFNNFAVYYGDRNIENASINNVTNNPESLATGILTITGGTFDADPSAYVADGYHVDSVTTPGSYIVVAD